MLSNPVTKALGCSSDVAASTFAAKQVDYITFVVSRKNIFVAGVQHFSRCKVDDRFTPRSDLGRRLPDSALKRGRYISKPRQAEIDRLAFDCWCTFLLLECSLNHLVNDRRWIPILVEDPL